MSQENVEIVRRGSERFNDSDIEGFLELCASEIEFRDLPELPGSGVFIGHDGMRTWWAQIYDSFEDVRFHADELIDGGDRVLAVTHGSGRGKSSGARVDMHFTNVWTLSEGKITSVVSYSDHSEAARAAGLSE